MRHLTAFLVSTAAAFAASALLLVAGWRFNTLDLFTGAAVGLVLGFVGASILIASGRREHRRPSPARYALGGAVMGFVNFLAASAAVAAQPWLAQGMATSIWNKAVLALTGGWMLARAAADPDRVLVIAVASVASGLVAGLVYSLMLRRRVRSPIAAGRLTPARP